MIEAVAFVPQAPLLVPALTGGTSVELDEVRDACRSAIAQIAPGRRLVVVGPGPANAAYPANARGSLAGHGVDLEIGLGSDASGPVELPVSLTVGAWLVRDAVGPDSGAVGYTVGADEPEVPPTVGDAAAALVVLGDGSATRSVKAPRYLDPRGSDYDRRVADALQSGDAGRLPTLQPDDDQPVVFAAGAPVWDAVGRLLAGEEWDADLRYDAAPFGVGYFVAVWQLRG